MSEYLEMRSVMNEDLEMTWQSDVERPKKNEIWAKKVISQMSKKIRRVKTIKYPVLKCGQWDRRSDGARVWRVWPVDKHINEPRVEVVPLSKYKLKEVRDES